ncbi:MAG: low specificity L-threonine aldolase [Chthoniobacter sp.]
MSSSASPPRRHFASDNFAGICPEAWAAMEAANVDHAPSYGEDRWNVEAVQLIREIFEADCEVFFVFTGTSANSLAVASACAPFESVLCSEHAHLISDECGAAGFFAHGVVLEGLPAWHGKVPYPEFERAAVRRTDIHHSRTRLISITQSTELGTVYSVEEVAAVGTVADRLGLRFHMDGARFANAVAALGVPPRAITWEAGVDVLSFGGAKNGLACGEALIFFDRHLARDFAYRRKQSGQLASKMRFLAAPWLGLLRDGAWLRHAGHANAMAADLERGLRGLPGVEIAHPREANAVFAKLPPPVVAGLRARGWQFYHDVGPSGAARLMGAWDTRPEDVAAFVADAAEFAK